MADYIYLNSEYASILKAKGLMALKRLLEWSEGELVGEHGARTTWRTTLPDGQGRSGTYYIRQEHRIPGREVLEDLFHFHLPTSRGFKTFRAAQMLTAAGIGVAPLCCLIERRHLGLPFSAVAVQAQAPGKDLYTQLLSYGRPDARMGNPAERRFLLSEVGRLLAKLGRAKIGWPDLAAKHIFVDPVDPGRRVWRLTLIDVERVSAGATARQRDRQMDGFLRSLRGLLSPSDLVRIALGYLGLDTRHPGPVRRKLWEKMLPRGLEQLRRARAEMRVLRNLPDDDPLPEEELFERVGGMVVNMRFKTTLKELGLLDKASLFAFRGGDALEKPGLGRRLRMRFEALHQGRRIWLYLKRIVRAPIADQWDRIASGTVRHSRCWHERYIIKQLGRHRIPAPVVVGYAEKMFFAYEAGGVLLTRGIVGQSLERFVPKHLARGASMREVLERRAWIVQLGEMIGRFHRAGFCHRDLYLSHIFIGFKRNGRPVFYLIDLARAFRPVFRRGRWLVKDLAALHFSSPRDMIGVTDRLRFIRAYLGVRRLSDRDKDLIRRVVRKAESMRRHYEKRRSRQAVK